MTNPHKLLYPEERRLATVMFADVQGFTSLADQLDFEVVGDLMREIWELVDHVIESHGGYIDKHIGDAIMVVWGAPQAREDDAERAVSAALVLQDTLAKFTENSPNEYVRQLKMRVGVNTGQVLAGYVGLRGEYTVLGDTVNIASRLETTAEPGYVVIGDNTYRLVRGLFRVQIGAFASQRQAATHSGVFGRRGTGTAQPTALPQLGWFGNLHGGPRSRDGATLSQLPVRHSISIAGIGNYSRRGWVGQEPLAHGIYQPVGSEHYQLVGTDLAQFDTGQPGPLLCVEVVMEPTLRD